MNTADCRKEWREYKATLEHENGLQPNLRVAVAGSMTVDPVEPYLGAHLLRKGFRPHVVVGPFNQLQRICYDHQATLGADDLNAIVLIWRLEDLFPELLAGCLREEGTSRLLGELTRLAEAIAGLRRRFDGTLIVSTPPYPSMSCFDILELGQAQRGMATFHAISQFWTRKIREIERVRLMDMHGLLLKVGIEQAQDSRKWLLYRQPYTETLWLEVGCSLGRMLAAEKISSKKCVVVDLDNTLWGGVIGEDRLEGIELSDDFPGNAYREFQRQLLHLKNKGVLLAVASKNNPEDVFEVFEKHDAMILSRQDFAAFEVHWDSKVESIRRIAAKLNLGLDSFVFVDDNPREIAEVKERLPEVSCVLVSEELADLPGLLTRDTDFFDVAELTDEDRRRTEMLAADELRHRSRETMSEDEFLKSLNLQVEVFPVEKQHVTRVTQLINKTNQFNLTTIRRTQDEVEALMASTDVLVLGMNVKDRYGDYGLVGVSILRKQNKICVIDTLLMSCRVLGRRAEDEFMARLAEACADLGCEQLQGRYIPTPKNGLVKDLYRRFNFAPAGMPDVWTRPIVGNVQRIDTTGLATSNASEPLNA